jgi:hypothetical protein
MWQKLAIAGAILGAAVGTGTVAVAATGSTTSGTPLGTSTSSSAPVGPPGGSGPRQGPAHRRHLGMLRRAVHATWVSKDPKSNKFVTHEAIRGQVTAVSATSISVKAADNTSQTYTVTSSTKVRQRTDRKGAAGTISAVHKGDDVAVMGTGTGTPTANVVIDLKK